MIPSTDTFVAHVAGHAGVSASRAERASRIVLSALGRYLSPPKRELVADELPAPLAAVLLEGDDQGRPLEERVREPSMRVGHAHEPVTAVCCVLSEELSREAMHALRASLPRPIARLFVGS